MKIINKMPNPVCNLVMYPTDLGVQIVNADTGEPIPNIASVDWHCDTQGLPYAIVKLVNVNFPRPKVTDETERPAS